MEQILRIIKKSIPKSIFRTLQPAYHRTLAFLGALRYRFPSQKLFVIGVTGTKGKSTTCELVASILEEAGYIVSLSSTIHFRIAGETKPNLYKMSMPGRFFMQRFLSESLKKGCSFAVLEMTSEGARHHRHKHIDLDALIFTNLTPEHIESHGSFDQYKNAKLSLRDALASSKKQKKIIVVNKDDEHADSFLEAPQQITKITYSIKNAEPYATNERGTLLTFEGKSIHSPLPGTFNIYNILAAATITRSIGIPTETIKRAVEKLSIVKGRVERIEEGQRFGVIVDYAHTADSLEKLYQSFPDAHKICVLGNCGGGRDTSKRPVMATIAEKYCREIILTNEDPYDEDPQKIVTQMAEAMIEKKPTIIMDRRLAIRHALNRAQDYDIVFITGKGTDPYIMGPHGHNTPWSDEKVVREELQLLLGELKQNNTSSNGNV